MSLAEFRKKVRKRETPFYDSLYRMAKRVRRFEIPYIPGWHDLLYHERKIRINAWRTFWRLTYHQPMFRSRCKTCGPGLHINHSGQGLPYIEGNIEINIGSDVKLFDRITIAGLYAGENPKLIIGDNTDLPLPISILVGNEVNIGSNCLIVSSTISDNPGHNVDYRERFEKLDPENIGRVVIGDYVWAALQSVIIGNVTIGSGAVIAARAIVTKNVPPFCMVAGNPARIVKKLPFPGEMREKLGEEAFQEYESAIVEK